MTRALFALLLFATPLCAQVEPVIQMHRGEFTTLVRNGGAEVLRYDVELLARTAPDTGAIILGRVVNALISPRSFTLAPGQRQILRVRLREASPTPTLGLSITMTPIDEPTPEDTATGVHITIVVRYVAKVLLQ